LRAAFFLTPLAWHLSHTQPELLFILI
jgi:hypothetical protein